MIINTTNLAHRIEECAAGRCDLIRIARGADTALFGGWGIRI